MKHLPYLLIGLVVFFAAGFYIDRTSTQSQTSSINLKQKLNNIMDEKLTNLGPAPDFTGISNWLNTEPLTQESLKGKVVLVDFWTYSCINCIRTLPYITSWYEKYKNNGLVIVGVHTPEFEFEKVTANVQTAIKRYHITYPVAQDNNFATWNAYNNRYWPAHYLIDKDGNIRYTHFGEGNYDITENNIRYLLGLNTPAETKNPVSRDVKSPEMYFGLKRLEYMSPNQTPNTETLEYKLPEKLKLNQFALAGFWKFYDERIESLDRSHIRLRFSAGKVFMVASAKKPLILKISVDGVNQPDVTVEMSQLYNLFDSEDYREHTIDIEIPGQGFEAYTFTFG